MRIRSPVFALTAATLLLAGGARAGIIRVPEDYPTVVAGVSAATPGDSVLVGPGTWQEHDITLKPGVSLISVAGAAATVLQTVTRAATVVHLTPGSAPAHVVGFTITGGWPGVLTYGTSFLATTLLEVDACRLVANVQAAVWFSNAEVTLRNCLISENGYGADYPYPAVNGVNGNVTCLECTFERNRGPGLGVEMNESWGYGVHATVHYCLFQDHALRGAVFGNVGYLDVDRCTFLRCSVAHGTNGNGGGLSAWNCYGRIRFSTFAFDSAGGGGGADLQGSEVSLENNTFYRCYAGTLGGALVFGPYDGGVLDNIIANSTGRRGAVEGPHPGPRTGCNLYWNNAEGDYYSGGLWSLVATDIHADPLFCDPATLDLHLNANSPATSRNAGSCGLIGALDVGCGAVSVEPTTWGHLKALYR